MTPEEQRSAIALACGHRRTTCPAGEIEWRGPGGQFLGRFAPDSIPDKVPDYLNDLNDCHEAEKVLGMHHNQQWSENIVGEALHHSCHSIEKTNGWDWVLIISRLSASQRCKVLLKTLNLWTP